MYLGRTDETEKKTIEDNNAEIMGDLELIKCVICSKEKKIGERCSNCNFVCKYESDEVEYIQKHIREYADG